MNAVTREVGATPLMMAATFGGYKVAAILIGAGADVSCRDRYQRTALHTAALGGRVKVVRILLELCPGIDINPIDEDGNTPLHKACSRGYWGTARALLGAGAVTNIKNNVSVSAFSFGLMEDRFGPEEIGLFMRHGAFMEDYDYYGISINPNLNSVLRDVDICTRSIVNKFNHQSLPDLYRNEDLARLLPTMELMKLSSGQTQEIEKFVKSEIVANSYCNVGEARPILLTLMCVQSLLNSRA